MFDPTASITSIVSVFFNSQGLASNIYGFDAQDAKNQKYDKILELFNKGLLTKNLIKPHYSS